MAQPVRVRRDAPRGRAFLAAAASQTACPLWGEDDTRRILPRAQIDVEFLNPLDTTEIAELWQR